MTEKTGRQMLGDVVGRVKEIAREHTVWRSHCFNMSAAESVTSPLVKELLASDFSRRYAIPGYYAGYRYVEQLKDLAQELIRSIYGGKYADVRPISGHITVNACSAALVKPGEALMITSPENGGHNSRLWDWAGVRVVHYPFDVERWNIDAEAAVKKIQSTRPKLIIIGNSYFLFPSPVEALLGAAREMGAKVYFDGSHVMGLIAGGQFQRPLELGVDVLAGSTHKTFSGPQGGVIVTNDKDVHDQIANTLDQPPYLISNYHPAHIAALTVAAAEMKEFGPVYAKQVIANAHALGEVLVAEGLPVVAARHGITKSHQVIMNFDGMESERAFEVQSKLQDCNIIVDATVRLGVQELTRVGMKEPEMSTVGRLISDVVNERRSPDRIRQDVVELMNAHQDIRFSFQSGESAYAFIGRYLS